MRCLICGADHASCKGTVEVKNVITLPRREKMADEYTADKALFVDKDDKLVEANDPNKVRKIADVGGTLSAEDAARYGLTGEAEDAVDSEASEPTPKKAAKQASKSSKKSKR
jgi:hypothetical protein